MAIQILNDAPPLQEDASGAVRIGNSRVLLELVIRAFQDGATPEAIVQRYPTTSLKDIYAAIAYYLRHPEDIERYLVEREQKAEAIKHKIETNQGDLSQIRSRLKGQQNSQG